MPQSADKEPLVATVLALAGKYIVLDKGIDDGVQVGDIFDDGEGARIKHPNGKVYWVRGVTAEMYVEQVFSDHCLVVMTYALRVPYFDNQETVNAGGYTVQKGHPHRLTSGGLFVGSRP